MVSKKLPIGIDDFEKLRSGDYYYVDKSEMIEELLNNLGEVNLFTRPRRFGKTLNMSMLKCFFEIGADRALFDDLAISREKELCQEYMGKFPVLNFSLKQVQGLDYRDAEKQMWIAVSLEAERYRFLLESPYLDDLQKESLSELRMQKGDLSSAIMQLSRLLYTHYQQKVIILIDEYDVPLQKAEESGYYREMVKLISQIFGYSMKTNPFMKFAVVTGCLRVSKESIFTGFNNVKVHSIIDREYAEWFGFTDREVQEMLTYYGKSDYYALTKDWYDGYLFGDIHVYCPWDVICWVNQMKRSEDYSPRNFWANSSGNGMITRFASRARGETKRQLEQLIEGGTVRKKLNLELTYDELDAKVENLWSVLFMTGYLTHQGRNEAGEYELKIPNREIHNLFTALIDLWFQDTVLGDEEKIKVFYAALDAADGEQLEQCLRSCLEKSISYLDGGRLKEKEAFYHGMLMGMLQFRENWCVKSNREAGEGRLDIVACSDWGDQAVIIECKYVKEYDELESGAQAALRQIREKKYDQYFELKWAKDVKHIGIAFCRKRCRVLAEKK